MLCHEDWASGCLIFGGGTIGIQVWCGVNFILMKGKVQKSNKKNEKEKQQHTFALERKKEIRNSFINLCERK